jgi:uncharacterized protein
MVKQKIFNDPVYGFTAVPKGILLDLIDHPFFQRLRRIRQTGLAHYVYPGALHTRFHHALGALHLMQDTILVLRSKDVVITDEEAEAVCIAILLHDIGHGPYSHALEHTIIDLHHENLSVLFMEALNSAFTGKLTLAIAIFSDQYHKRFLHQLVSGQLDMDRMDYLNRDSFFTGVSEGVIGYDRIIKMLDVHEGELVVEEKGIYSVEKFLIARRLMYWQVYLHKTNVAAEQMLTSTLRRAKELTLKGEKIPASRHLTWFLQQKPGQLHNQEEVLQRFAHLDDTDIAMALKEWSEEKDPVLRFLASGLLNRRLYRLEWSQQPFTPDYIAETRLSIRAKFDAEFPDSYLLLEGKESNQAYSEAEEPIKILFNTGVVKPVSECSDVPLYTQEVTKYYLAYPK